MMKKSQIAFGLELVLGIALIIFMIFQAFKNMNDWIEVPGAFKEFLWSLPLYAVAGLIGWGIAQLFIQ